MIKKMSLCHICGKPASRTCRLCGRPVCDDDFDPANGVCRIHRMGRTVASQRKVVMKR